MDVHECRPGAGQDPQDGRDSKCCRQPGAEHLPTAVRPVVASGAFAVNHGRSRQRGVTGSRSGWSARARTCRRMLARSCRAPTLRNRSASLASPRQATRLTPSTTSAAAPAARIPLVAHFQDRRRAVRDAHDDTFIPLGALQRPDPGLRARGVEGQDAAGGCPQQLLQRAGSQPQLVVAGPPHVGGKVHQDPAVAVHPHERRVVPVAYAVLLAELDHDGVRRRRELVRELGRARGGRAERRQDEYGGSREQSAHDTTLASSCRGSHPSRCDHEPAERRRGEVPRCRARSQRCPARRHGPVRAPHFAPHFLRDTPARMRARRIAPTGSDKEN